MSVIYANTEFSPPQVGPASSGLFAATQWTEETGLPRWLAEGVRLRPQNYGGELSAGTWTDPWCPDLVPDEPGLKYGVRPDIPDPFAPVTVWAYDANQCGDLSEESRNEVRSRARQNLRLHEQVIAEREFAERLLLDAGTPATAADLVEAVGELELAFAATNTTGFIHAPANLAAVASRYQLLLDGGRTPLGHRWVFGYATGLGETLVATSQPFGWRDAVQLREATDPQTNTFVAIAERSLVIAVEHVLAAVQIGASA